MIDVGIKIVVNINQTRNNYCFSDLKFVAKIHLNCIFILFILTCSVVLFCTFVYKKIKICKHVNTCLEIICLIPMVHRNCSQKALVILNRFDTLKETVKIRYSGFLLLLYYDGPPFV